MDEQIDNQPGIEPEGAAGLGPAFGLGFASGLPSARGGRKAELAIEIDFVRELCEADREGLLRGAGGAAAGPSLVALRQSHHQLAQLIVSGAPQEEISLISGYSPSYISNIQNNPAFAGLMAHYATVRELKFADVVDRMRSLGLDTLEQLQEQITENPEKFSTRERLEIIELMLVKPMVAARSAGGSGGGAAPAVTFNIGFKTPLSNIPQPGNVIDVVIEGEKE